MRVPRSARRGKQNSWRLFPLVFTKMPFPQYCTLRRCSRSDRRRHRTSRRPSKSGTVSYKIGSSIEIEGACIGTTLVDYLQPSSVLLASLRRIYRRRPPVPRSRYRRCPDLAGWSPRSPASKRHRRRRRFAGPISLGHQEPHCRSETGEIPSPSGLRSKIARLKRVDDHIGGEDHLKRLVEWI